MRSRTEAEHRLNVHHPALVDPPALGDLGGIVDGLRLERPSLARTENSRSSHTGDLHAGFGLGPERDLLSRSSEREMIAR